jgi:hypothetical protein
MCIIPGFVLNFYGKHCDGREAFKAGLDALSGFRVMNTSEGAGHDDLTRLPAKPTPREMVGE